MSAVVCLLTIIHMVRWLYVKNIHSLRRFSTLVRIGGGGYRVLAKLGHTRSRHFERVLAMYTKPRSGHNDYPLELWLGKVSFRFPYLRGFIISFLLKEMKPSDFWWLPDELFPTKRVRTPLSGLCSEPDEGLASHVHWYRSVANSPDVSLSDFFFCIESMRKNGGSTL
ncbi:hypothetical protein IFM89_002239 [Coptis chinensis]|uniref:Uncharacterized protein n=1 Tax=Coptis chinensis TaxID=261450 RepID=A0A835IK08_9MAGN|nr:hypothetical protein IFM89_002239 [Coptis chinensis]